MAQQAAAGPHVYAVGELVAGLKSLLEDRIGRLWVVGEISNLHRARSGHFYFSLKDERGQIRCALFRGNAQRLAFEPEDGLEALVYADVTLYEERGELQLVVRQLEPRGRGALQLAFEQLRRRLEAEGLFDAARKRPLPPRPACVGVVTSAEGAAVRDVLAVTGRRFPATRIVLAPTRVQGPDAEREIAAVLDAVASQPGVELVLLVRGGGSLEDLQPFNTEVVARAIAAAPVPVVAGVGHEVDGTIADLAADVRAPTPSAAAELTLPDRGAVLAHLEKDWQRLLRAVRAVMQRLSGDLEREGETLRAHAPSERLAAQRARLGAAARALERAAQGDFRRAGAGLAAVSARLDALSPLAVLGRGYALARIGTSGAIVRSADQVAPGDELSVRVAEAEIRATVRAVRRLDPD